MRFHLHIFLALAVLGFVSTVAVMGAEQGLTTATPGRIAICGTIQQPCEDDGRGEFRQAANTIGR